MIRGHINCVAFVRILFGVVFIFGTILAAITIHSFYPITDPVTPIGLIDRVSLFMGVHEQSAVVVIDLDTWSSTVYTYIFHRRIYDGTFHIAFEHKDLILPGIFGAKNETIRDNRLNELLEAAGRHVPVHGGIRIRPEPCHVDPCRIPLLAKVSSGALEMVSKTELSSTVTQLQRHLENSHFGVSSEVAVGHLSQLNERALQWFSINLLLHNLHNFVVSESAVVVDVGDTHLNLTFAVSGLQYNQLPKTRVTALKKLSAFGHHIKLVTLTYTGLGLYRGREHVFNLTATPSSQGPISVRNACVNPICDAHWEWNGKVYRVRGLEKGDYELVKERNGPFAGKKINRPVANYDYCHNVFNTYISQILNETNVGDKNEDAIALAFVQQRPVFMEGMLREKCIERGLSLPYLGGDVKMRAFLDSLKHACKVPNTEQPFACIDLMFLATLLDKMLGLKQGSFLRSTSLVNAMTAEWPLAAAFYVYQNGL